MQASNVVLLLVGVGVVVLNAMIEPAARSIASAFALVERLGLLKGYRTRSLGTSTMTACCASSA